MRVAILLGELAVALELCIVKMGLVAAERAITKGFAGEVVDKPLS